MHKRIISVICIAALTASCLCGCGNKKTTAESGDKVKITLSFWDPGTDREFETAFTSIVAEYKKVKPNVEVELQPQAFSGYQEWIKAQFSAGNAPDIEYNNPGDLVNQSKSGLLINLNDELKKPNEYNNGKVWQDSFLDGKLELANPQSAGLKDFRGSIPVSGLGLAFFYNKKIYSDLGLKEPKTWNEFLNNCEVIDKSGTNPVAFMAQKADALQWIAWGLHTGMYSNMFLADSKFNLDGDSGISTGELAKAVDSGYYDITKPGKYRDAYLNFIKTVKDFSKYTPNATGLDETGAKTQFLSGKAAHILSGSWDIKAFLLDEEKPFEIGAFSFPYFTTDNSEYAGGKMRVPFVQPMGITTGVKQSKAKEEAAIDFMKFLTSPKIYKTFVETTYAMPIIKDIDVDPVFKAFQDGDTNPFNIYFMTGATSKFNSQNAMVAVLSGEEMSDDTVCQDVQNSIEDYVKEQMESTDLSAENNYRIDEETGSENFVKKDPVQ